MLRLLVYPDAPGPFGSDSRDSTPLCQHTEAQAFENGHFCVQLDTGVRTQDRILYLIFDGQPVHCRIATEYIFSNGSGEVTCDIPTSRLSSGILSQSLAICDRRKRCDQASAHWDGILHCTNSMPLR
jgi:hypothetical protein